MGEYPNNIIEFENVGFAYPGDKPLFHNLCLALQPRTFYVVQGSSGSGKSTFLRLINRLEEPMSGQIRFKGKILSEYAPSRLRRSILYIQQTPITIDASVRENLLLPFRFKKNQDLQKPDDSSLSQFLKDFLLNDIRLDDHAQTLSLGQQQRLCFIRGLMLSPEILLLDEPTSSLDPESGAVVMDSAEKLCRESGLSVLLVSHQIFTPRSIQHGVLVVGNGGIKELT